MIAELTRHGGRLPRAVGSARAPVAERFGLLLKVTDDQGRVGWGEASPLPGFSRDTIDECEIALQAWCDNLPHLDLRAPAAARFAVETALMNLRGAPSGSVPLAAVVADVDEARGAVARGIACLKVKIGRDFDEELRRLRAIRDVVGGAVALRLDVNQAWTRAEAPSRLRALAPLRPEFVEEPVAGGLDGPRLDSPVPLAADETLLDGRIPPVDVLVLKPMALGGFAVCRRLARAFGGPVVVTHLWDGPVALAAATALALSIGAEQPLLACGLDRHAGLAVWP